MTGSTVTTPSPAFATAPFAAQAVPRHVFRAMHRARRVAAAGASPHGPEFEATLVARLVYGAEGNREIACKRLAIVLPLLRPTRCKWVVGPVFRRAIREAYPPERAREMIATLVRGNVGPAERLPGHRPVASEPVRRAA